MCSVLHVQQTLEQANAQADQGNDHEHQQDRSLYDGRTNLRCPAHSASEDLTDIANQSGDSSGSSRSAEPPFSMNQYLDCLANEAEANKTKKIKHRRLHQKISHGKEICLGEHDHIIHSSKAPPPISES